MIKFIFCIGHKLDLQNITIYPILIHLLYLNS